MNLMPVLNISLIIIILVPLHKFDMDYAYPTVLAILQIL